MRIIRFGEIFPAPIFGLSQQSPQGGYNVQSPAGGPGRAHRSIRGAADRQRLQRHRDRPRPANLDDVIKTAAAGDLTRLLVPIRRASEK